MLNFVYLNQGCGSGSWKRKRWKRLIFCVSGSELGSGSVEKKPEAEAIFFKIRRFRILNLATTVGVKCYNNNNNIKTTTRAWYGMEWKIEWNETEVSVWNMEDARMKWNGRFQEWNGRQSSIILYQFHSRFCTLYLQKNTYRCRVVINNIATEVFNINIYG